MEILLCLDVLGVVIILFVLVSVYFSRVKTYKHMLDTKIFKALTVSSLILLTIDMLIRFMTGKVFEFAGELNAVFHAFYYLFHSLICFLWVLYIDYSINKDKERFKKKQPYYFIPVIINILLLSINFFIPYIYIIDDKNIYRLGNLSVISTLIAFIYSISAIIILTNTRKLDNGEKRKLRKYMLLLPLFPIISALIHPFFYGGIIIWAFSVFTILIIHLNIKNKQLSTDYLTGLSNRRSFESYSNEKFKNTSANKELFIILADIDRFKNINLLYGHNEGNKALVCLSDILKKSIDKDDYLARFCGDVFIIISERSYEYEIYTLFDRIIENVKTFNLKNELRYKIGVSLGVSIYGKNDAYSIERLLCEAEEQIQIMKTNAKSARLSENCAGKKYDKAICAVN